MTPPRSQPLTWEDVHGDAVALLSGFLQQYSWDQTGTAVVYLSRVVQAAFDIWMDTSQHAAGGTHPTRAPEDTGR